jgi:hypothetical protein
MIGVSQNLNVHQSSRQLIFDELQQQSMEESSFREILRHAAAEMKCQIIVTTSHKRKTIGTYPRKIGTAHIVEFGDEGILQKMSS